MLKSFILFCFVIIFCLKLHVKYNYYILHNNSPRFIYNLIYESWFECYSHESVKIQDILIHILIQTNH